MDWWLQRDGVRDLRLFYGGEITDKERTDKYRLETVPRSGYNLTISNLADDDSGTYICKRSKEERRFSVKVTSRSTTTLPTSSTTDVTGSLTLSAFFCLSSFCCNIYILYECPGILLSVWRELTERNAWNRFIITRAVTVGTVRSYLIKDENDWVKTVTM